jgi:hypothetical protein
MTFFILQFKIRENSLKFAKNSLKFAKNSLKFSNFKLQNEECHHYDYMEVTSIFMFYKIWFKNLKFHCMI